MKITIEVNGKEVELTEFPAKIITNILLGILESLRGVDEINMAEFRISAEE